jgi:hypothetical protein
MKLSSQDRRTNLTHGFAGCLDYCYGHVVEVGFSGLQNRENATHLTKSIVAHIADYHCAEIKILARDISGICANVA